MYSSLEIQSGQNVNRSIDDENIGRNYVLYTNLNIDQINIQTIVFQAYNNILIYFRICTKDLVLDQQIIYTLTVLLLQRLSYGGVAKLASVKTAVKTAGTTKAEVGSHIIKLLFIYYGMFFILILTYNSI